MEVDDALDAIRRAGQQGPGRSPAVEEGDAVASSLEGARLEGDHTRLDLSPPGPCRAGCVGQALGYEGGAARRRRCEERQVHERTDDARPFVSAAWWAPDRLQVFAPGAVRGGGVYAG